jgi:hypothetical protein
MVFSLDTHIACYLKYALGPLARFLNSGCEFRTISKLASNALAALPGSPFPAWPEPVVLETVPARFLRCGDDTPPLPLAVNADTGAGMDSTGGAGGDVATPTPLGEGGRDDGALGAANASSASSDDETGVSAAAADDARAPRAAAPELACVAEPCACADDGSGCCRVGSAGGAGGRTSRPPARTCTSASDVLSAAVTFACAGAARRARCPPAAARELDAAVCFAKRELTSAAVKGVSLARVSSVRTRAAVASSSSAASASRDDGGWSRGDASM